MKLRSRIFWKKPKIKNVPKPEYEDDATFVKYDGGYTVAVVGESRYQDALEAICGRRRESADLYFRAYLIKEEDNPYDDQAVHIEIQGRKVGYLRRGNARAYRRWLDTFYPGVEVIGCQANVRGGWDRGGDDVGSFGVWLDLPNRFAISAGKPSYDEESGSVGRE